MRYQKWMNNLVMIWNIRNTKLWYKISLINNDVRCLTKHPSFWILSIKIAIISWNNFCGLPLSVDRDFIWNRLVDAHRIKPYLF